MRAAELVSVALGVMMWAGVLLAAFPILSDAAGHAVAQAGGAR